MLQSKSHVGLIIDLMFRVVLNVLSTLQMQLFNLKSPFSSFID